MKSEITEIVIAKGESFVSRFLWNISGANPNVIERLPSHWKKFEIVGISILASSVLGTVGLMAVPAIFSTGILLTIFYALSILAFFLITYSTIAAVIWTKMSLPILLFYLVLCACISMMTSVGLSLSLFSASINAASSDGVQYSLLNSLRVLEHLMSTDVQIQALYWFIFAFFLLQQISPLLLIAFSKKDIYLEGMEALENMDSSSFYRDIKIEQEQRYREQSQATVTQPPKKDGVHLLPESLPLGGFECYINYQTLSLVDINRVFESIDSVYQAVYKIMNEPGPEMTGYHFDQLVKSSPEDVLVLHSIETGNSISFKVSTNWKMNVELIEKDVVVTLPKGSVPLVIGMYVISMVLKTGIASYREILEIEKLQKEIAVLEEPSVGKFIDTFNSKLDSASLSDRKYFEAELLKFKSATVDNPNIIETRITQDSVLVNSIIKDGRRFYGLNLNFETK